MVEARIAEVQDTEPIKHFEVPSFRERFKDASRYALLGVAAISLALILACSPTRAQTPSAGIDSGPGIVHVSELTPTPLPEEVTISPPEPTLEPEPTPTPEPLSTPDLLAMVENIIDLIKNPDPELIIKLGINETNLKLLTGNLISGADPKTIAAGKTFLPDSLMGIKDLIGKGEYKEAQKKIRNEEGGFRTGVYPLLLATGLSTHPDYSVRLDPDEAARIDPEKRFHSLRLSVPRPFENAAKGLIQLHYDLDRIS